jgi:hypothetical protein
MNDVMHEHLNKLRIISKIHEGQKLDTSNGLYIYTDGWVSWAIRKWYRDNKDEGVRYLRDLYKSFGQSVETVITEARTSSNETRRSQAIYVLINAATELRASISGLNALSKTYTGYPTTVAALEGILRDYVIVTYSLLVEAIPENRRPTAFNESIMYAGQIIIKGKDLPGARGSPKLAGLAEIVPPHSSSADTNLAAIPSILHKVEKADDSEDRPDNVEDS